MLILFPILLFSLAIEKTIRHILHVHSSGAHLIFLFVCAVVLIASVFEGRSTFYYWSFMFVVWSWITSFYCFLQFDIAMFTIGCWCFSAGCWQTTRLLTLM